MEPLLSIITVCFNAAKTIGPTLKSLREQTFTNFESVIIDGASTDGTLAVIDANKPNTTIILSEKDNGIYDAMNKGLAMAHGKYVLFLNAGDSLHGSDALSRVARAVESSNPDVVYGQTVIVDAKRETLGPRHLAAPENLQFDSFANGMVVCHQAFIARKDIAELYNLDYKYSADYDWCLRILKKSTKNVYLGPDPIVEYLNEGETTRHHKESLKERFKIMSVNYGTMPTALRHIKFLLRSIARKFK